MTVRRASTRRSAAGGASEAVTLKTLEAAIGSDGFYTQVAKLDPKNAAKWKTMVKVQQRFKLAEPSYRTDAARTYSESNRETLHRVTLKLLERKKPGDDLYRAFVELHPALFTENGAWKLPLDEQAAILSHTDPAMLLSNGNPVRLAEGLVTQDRWAPLVKEAADETRAARKAKGLPVTKHAPKPKADWLR